MNLEESKSYHALNTAFLSNYEQLKKVLGVSGSWKKAWDKLKKSPELNADSEWQKLEAQGINLILDKDPAFPPQLKEIPWPPQGIYVKGAPIAQDEKLIAIVGTRKATAQGKAMAKRFAKQLAESGLTVVSGLALGIDAAAHEGTLEAKGRTIAVLANGLDSIYPRQHHTLAKKILSSGGSLISEYPPGAPSLPKNFIERNRIISGLSLGIVIVEAPAESGALATARFALEQNREIFVVPGPVESQNYMGSHELIKSGAYLITSVNDVLTNLNLEKTVELNKERQQELAIGQLDENQKAVINVLKALGEKTATDRIAELAKLEVPLVNRAVSLLLIQGVIKEENGKYYV